MGRLDERHERVRMIAAPGFMVFESNAIVIDSIVRGFTKDLWAQAGSGTDAGGHITVSQSDFSTHVGRHRLEQRRDHRQRRQRRPGARLRGPHRWRLQAPVRLAADRRGRQLPARPPRVDHRQNWRDAADERREQQRPEESGRSACSRCSARRFNEPQLCVAACSAGYLSGPLPMVGRQPFRAGQAVRRAVSPRCVRLLLSGARTNSTGAPVASRRRRAAAPTAWTGGRAASSTSTGSR